MPGISKIAISLPQQLYQAVETERRQSGENRSQIFRRAITMLLRQQKEQEISNLYVQAYQKFPETKEEITANRRVAGNILTEEPRN